MQATNRARFLGAILWLWITNAMATVPESFTQADLAGGQPQSTTGELILNDGHSQTPALLLQNSLKGRVDGLVLTMTLTQRFRNPGEGWVNGKYVFPLPETAAVDSLTLRTDGRVIRGVVKEKRQAKKEFEAAREAGKRAGLLEQQRPNLFSMALANIAPGAEVEAEITWVDTIPYKGGRFALRLPTTLTPRFIPGKAIRSESARETIPIQAGSGWALDTDEVPDASAITPPQIREPSDDDIAATSNRFSLDLDIQAGLTLASVNSVTHGLSIENDDADPGRARVALSDEPMDRDVVIQWQPTASAEPRAAVFNQQADGAVYQLMMLLPPVHNVVRTLPRETLFIIDSSGSMSGVSMRQARHGLHEALQYLSPNDRFNIVDFDSSARTLFGRPVPATPDNLSRAAQFIDGLNADGGTNMRAALEAAFSQQRDESLLRQIVFMTDGSVGNEQDLFRFISDRLGDARLFTVGIGSAPNAHFMRGAAAFGRGSFQFIDSLAETGTAIAELFNRINRPVMKDIRVSWEGGGEVEAFPHRAPDLYVGEPLMLISRSDGPPSSAKVTGIGAGQPWERTLNTGQAAQADNLDKLWARWKVEQLESDQVIQGQPMTAIRDELVDIGVRHQLLNRFTSFIAIEDTPVRPVDTEARNQNVPNLMPAGNTMAIPVPQTATPAALMLMLGFLLLLLGGITRWYDRVRSCPA